MNSADLLRMLEPVVRPVGAPAGRSVEQVPLEERSFESLLEEERNRAREGLQGLGEAAEAQDASKPASPLGALAAMDAIENASLRSLIGRGGSAAA